MKRRTRITGLVAVAISALLVGWYATLASAEPISAGTSVVGPFNFQPLVSEPIEILRKVEMPNVATPIWLRGGR